MISTLKTLALTAVIGSMAALAQPAMAGGHVSFGIGFGVNTVYPAPVYPAPVYAAPVYAAPVYAAPVYTAPAYVAPAYAAPGQVTTVAPSTVYYAPAPVYAAPAYVAAPYYAPSYYPSPAFYLSVGTFFGGHDHYEH